MNRKLVLAVLASVAAAALVCSPGAAEEPKPQLEVGATPQEISVYTGEFPYGSFDISINNSDNESVSLKLAGAQLSPNWTLRFSINGSPKDSIEGGPRASVNFTAEAVPVPSIYPAER